MPITFFEVATNKNSQYWGIEVVSVFRGQDVRSTFHPRHA